MGHASFTQAKAYYMKKETFIMPLAEILPPPASTVAKGGRGGFGSIVYRQLPGKTNFFIIASISLLPSSWLNFV